MKIVAISDTHIPINAAKLPKKLLQAIETADLVVHTGDFVCLKLLELLKSKCKVKAVFGNMDSIEIRNELVSCEIFSFAGKKIGLIHGWGAPANLLQNIKDKFKNKNVDLVIFGHSHHPISIKEGKTIYFNPGSPTDKIFAPYNSFGEITIDKEIKTKIVKI